METDKLDLETYEKDPINYKGILVKVIGGFTFLFYMLSAGVIGSYVLKDSVWGIIANNILKISILCMTVGLVFIHFKMKDKQKKELLESESKLINSSSTIKNNGVDK